MVLKVFILLFFLHSGALCSLLVDTSASKGLSMPAVFREDRPVIEVLESSNLRNDCLTIISNRVAALRNAIVLQVQHFQVRHLHKNFIQHLRAVDFVALDVQTRKRRAVQHTNNVRKTLLTDFVVF